MFAQESGLCFFSVHFSPLYVPSPRAVSEWSPFPPLCASSRPLKEFFQEGLRGVAPRAGKAQAFGAAPVSPKKLRGNFAARPSGFG
jgi:hypothetical protein